jgi:hypothetical protein
MEDRTHIPEVDSLLLNAYEYTPLSQQQIRVVRIEPGEWAQEIRCSVQHVTRPSDWEAGPSGLSGAGPYEALSYVWGNPSERVPILCGEDGEVVFATPNCLAAIHRLRLPTGPRFIWIDALCINQNDVSERNAQVRNMGSIYRGASRVIVYLGEASDDSTEALDHILNMMAPQDGKYNDDLGRIIGHWYTRPDDENQHRRNRAVLQLLERPWFSRVWVLQEIWNAKEALVLCGPSMIPWKKLRQFILASSFRGLPVEIQGTPGIFSMNRPSSGRWHSRALPGLLQITRRCGATDPRDKFFSLLGMLYWEGGERLSVDYALSPGQVFLKVAIHVIRNTVGNYRNLAILSEVQGPTELHHSGMPSWVSDWSVPPERSKLVDLWQLERFFQAGGERADVRIVWTMNKPVNPLLAIGLKAKGVEIGAIKALGDTFHKEWLELDEMDLLFEQWTSLTIAHGEYGEFGDRDHNEAALCLSLCVGSTLPARMKGFMSLFVDYVLWRRYHRGQSIIEYAEADMDDELLCYDENGILSDEQRNKHIARANLFNNKVLESCHLRRLFVTANGYLGLAPEEAMVGDAVVVLYGARTPQILRKQEDHYVMIGECYVQGVMFGEALPGGHPDKYPREGAEWGPAGPLLDGHVQEFEIW